MLDRLGIDALIPIGGDDTLSFALRLHDEGVPVVAIPKTMDNDVHGTDYCIGFSTAITRTVIFIHQLRTSAGSHERLAVVEVFGAVQRRDLAGLRLPVGRRARGDLRGAVRHREARRQADGRTSAANPSGYAMMTISEGATMIGGEMVHAGMADAYGHLQARAASASSPASCCTRSRGEGIIYQQIGYLMRSGSPDSLDLMVGDQLRASMAADLVIEAPARQAGGAAQRQLRQRAARRSPARA